MTVEQYRQARDDAREVFHVKQSEAYETYLRTIAEAEAEKLTTIKRLTEEFERQ